MKSRIALIFSILLVTLGVDQATKSWAIQALRNHPMEIYLGDLFRFQYSENPGAFLSFGSDLSGGLRFWLLTVLVGLFVLGLLGYVIWNSRIGKLQTWGLALVCSGGLSNLLDRSFRTHGQVVDFMNMGIGNLRTGIFNVADMVIMAGIGILLFSNAKEAKTEPK